MARRQLGTDDVLDMIFGADAEDSGGEDAESDLDIAPEVSSDESSADETEQTINATDQSVNVDVNNTGILEGGWTKNFTPIQVSRYPFTYKSLRYKIRVGCLYSKIVVKIRKLVIYSVFGTACV